MSLYEQVVAEEAEKWFSDSCELLVWDWDHDAPGRCHPLSVVRAWEDRRSLPPQVHRRQENYLRDVLQGEWKRSGLPLGTIPAADSWADGEGRRVWRVHLPLLEYSEKVSHAFGRALLRDAGMPAWDFEWENLVCPEFSKTWVISLDDGEYIYEPTESTTMGVIEQIRSHPDLPSYFCLLQNRSGYFEANRYPEGAVVSMRLWHDLVERRFTHWSASVGAQFGCIVDLGDFQADESDLLPWAGVGPLALAFMSDPTAPPAQAGIIWRIVESTEA